MRLVPVEAVSLNGVDALQRPQAEGLRRRDGFALTDPGTDLVGALDEAHYCIWCHEQGKDSCAHGLLEKKRADRTDNPFKKSAVRRHARRLSARGAHLRVPQAARRRLAASARSR